MTKSKDGPQLVLETKMINISKKRQGKRKKYT